MFKVTSLSDIRRWVFKMVHMPILEKESKSKGFTLIKLLAVVVILGVLSVIAVVSVLTIIDWV